MRILVVEMDADSARKLAHDLRRHGHELQTACDGATALARSTWAEVILLEPDLPDVDGLDVCRKIREMGDSQIIIIISGQTAEVDCVLGLQAGCDDYIAKPYGLRELTARIEAVARRARRPSTQPRTIACGPLRIDPSSREVRVEDRHVAVTRKEFDLLYLLASERDEVIPRRRIMAEVWNNDLTMSNSRTIDTHVNTLRRKLGTSDWIITVRGVGFKIGSAR